MTWPTPEDLPRRGTVTAFDGRLVVDLDARVATVDGRAAQLTFKETDLLHGLVELGDGTHPAEEIMRRAWEVDWPHSRDLRVPIRILGNKGVSFGSARVPRRQGTRLAALSSVADVPQPPAGRCPHRMDSLLRLAMHAP